MTFFKVVVFGKIFIKMLFCWKKSQKKRDKFEILKVIKKHTREYSPFEVYAKALHELFKGRERTSDKWEQKESKI